MLVCGVWLRSDEAAGDRMTLTVLDDLLQGSEEWMDQRRGIITGRYADPTKVARARELRRQMTVAERLLWERLRHSSDAEVAGIAGKAVKEARYHQQHAADWLVRLGDGTAESRRRTLAAIEELWRYVPELFDADAVDEAAQANGLGPRWSDLREPWYAEMTAMLEEATLAVPTETPFRSNGKRGFHSEHMGFLLADMQQLQRSFPGGTW